MSLLMFSHYASIKASYLRHYQSFLTTPLLVEDYEPWSLYEYLPSVSGKGIAAALPPDTTT